MTSFAPSHSRLRPSFSEAMPSKAMLVERWTSPMSLTGLIFPSLRIAARKSAKSSLMFCESGELSFGSSVRVGCFASLG